MNTLAVIFANIAGISASVNQNTKTKSVAPTKTTTLMTTVQDVLNRIASISSLICRMLIKIQELKEVKSMKILLNMTALYDLMEKHGIETIRQLSRESGISCSILYGAFDRGVVSKETYWRLAKFFGCHIEDLQIPDDSE